MQQMTDQEIKAALDAQPDESDTPPELTPEQIVDEITRKN